MAKRTKNPEDPISTMFHAFVDIFIMAGIAVGAAIVAVAALIGFIIYQVVIHWP